MLSNASYLTTTAGSALYMPLGSDDDSMFLTSTATSNIYASITTVNNLDSNIYASLSTNVANTLTSYLQTNTRLSSHTELYYCRDYHMN